MAGHNLEKNAIIFGANGQDGHYLGKLCEERGIRPIGVSRSGSGILGDVSKWDQVETLVKEHQPEFIFHLAANSTTRHDAIFENHETISTGTLNILESVFRHSKGSKVFIAGSGLQFENHQKPISESDPFEARSPYAVARIQSVYAVRYFRTLGIRSYVGYLFHHESPLRKENHVSKKIALAVQRISRGSGEILELGDITVEKEWTFAGDVAEAILTLVMQDQVAEAVIGSGIPYSIERWLETTFGLIGKDWRQHVRVKDRFVPEYRRLVSNPARMNTLGWSQKCGLSTLAKMMIFENVIAGERPDG
jgi:GDPmannose 4,6-dehydratase